MSYNEYMLSKSPAEARNMMKHPEVMYETVMRDAQAELKVSELRHVVTLIKANHDSGFFRLSSKILHLIKRLS
jgi:hypothetical protein